MEPGSADSADFEIFEPRSADSANRPVRNERLEPGFASSEESVVVLYIEPTRTEPI